MTGSYGHTWSTGHSFTTGVVNTVPAGYYGEITTIAPMIGVRIAGVASSTGSNRDGNVMGLPQATVNITLDGMNIQDNYLKTTDGFFARLSPRLDAVEDTRRDPVADLLGETGAARVGLEDEELPADERPQAPLQSAIFAPVPLAVDE